MYKCTQYATYKYTATHVNTDSVFVISWHKHKKLLSLPLARLNILCICTVHPTDANNAHANTPQAKALAHDSLSISLLPLPSHQCLVGPVEALVLLMCLRVWLNDP